MNYKSSERHKKTSFARDNKKARKSCERDPENGKQKFNFNDSLTLCHVTPQASSTISCNAKQFNVELERLMFCKALRRNATPFVCTLTRDGQLDRLSFG